MLATMALLPITRLVLWSRSSTTHQPALAQYFNVKIKGNAVLDGDVKWWVISKFFKTCGIVFFS